MLIMHNVYPEGFDGVGAVGLFGTIMAVAAEDVSLGPIIHKSIMRMIGVCFGGFLGYIMLFFPVVLLPGARSACLFIILTVVVSGVQFCTKGGFPQLTAFLKQRKCSHMIIQFQIAFGTIFIGAWHSDTVNVMVATVRTLAIVYGCICLLVASMIALPQTSLHVSCAELAECLRKEGSLAVTIINDRTRGVEMQPFDHHAKEYAPLKPKPDEHIKLMESIETKLARGNSDYSFLI